MRVMFTCFLFFYSFIGLGQTPISSKIESLGGSAVSLSELDNLFQNPGSFSSTYNHPKKANFQLLASYKPNLLHENIDETILYLGLNVLNKFHFGVGGGGFNFYNLYKQHFLGLGFSRNFGPHFQMGVSWAQHTQSFLDYESLNHHKFNFGGTYNLSKQFKIGLAVNHIYSQNLHNNEAFWKFSSGISYRPYDLLILMTDWVWATEEAPVFNSTNGFDMNVGFEYALIPDVLFLRGGWKKSLMSQHVGIGYHFSTFKIQVSGTHNRNQTLLPQFDIAYATGR